MAIDVRYIGISGDYQYLYDWFEDRKVMAASGNDQVAKILDTSFVIGGPVDFTASEYDGTDVVIQAACSGLPLGMPGRAIMTDPSGYNVVIGGNLSSFTSFDIDSSGFTGPSMEVEGSGDAFVRLERGVNYFTGSGFVVNASASGTESHIRNTLFLGSGTAVQGGADSETTVSFCGTFQTAGRGFYDVTYVRDSYIMGTDDVGIHATGFAHCVTSDTSASGGANSATGMVDYSSYFENPVVTSAHDFHLKNTSDILWDVPGLTVGAPNLDIDKNIRSTDVGPYEFFEFGTNYDDLGRKIIPLALVSRGPMVIKTYYDMNCGKQIHSGVYYASIVTAVPGDDLRDTEWQIVTERVKDIDPVSGTLYHKNIVGTSRVDQYGKVKFGVGIEDASGLPTFYDKSEGFIAVWAEETTTSGYVTPRVEIPYRTTDFVIQIYRPPAWEDQYFGTTTYEDVYFGDEYVDVMCSPCQL